MMETKPVRAAGRWVLERLKELDRRDVMFWSGVAIGAAGLWGWDWRLAAVVVAAVLVLVSVLGALRHAS